MSSVSRKIRNSVRRDRSFAESYHNKLEAWSKGRESFVTLPTNEKKRHPTDETKNVSVRYQTISLRGYLGDPRASWMFPDKSRKISVDIEPLVV